MNVRRQLTALICAAVAASSPASTPSLGLEQVIREMSTNSDSAKAMKETLWKSDQVIREKWAGVYPSASASVSAARQYSPAMLPPPFAPVPDKGGDGYYNTSIAITQTIYTFGKVNTAITVAGQVDSSVHCAYRRSMQQLQLLALDAFYRVVLADMAVNVSERSLARNKEINEFLERNFAMGSGAKAQLLLTRADVKSQWADVITARQNAHSARMQLSALMGRELTDSILPDTTRAVSGLLRAGLPSPDSAVASANAHRGDLRAFEFYRKANEGGAKILRAMYLPSIAARGAFGIGGTEPGDMVDLQKRNWSLGVGLQWNFFDGFENSARSQQYRSDARKLQIAHDAVAKQVRIEVLDALAECAAADSNLIAAREMLAATRESYDLTNENFKQGSGQFSDLQLTEQRLRQAEMGSVYARYRVLRSRAAVLVSTGNDIVAMEGP